MKKLLIPFTLLALFFLGACEETVYKEVIKYIDRPVPGPTQFITTSTETECEGIDTLSLSVEIKQNGTFDKDTLMHLSTACYALLKIRGYVLVPKETVLVPGDSVPYPVPYPVPGDSIPYPVPGDSIPYPVPYPVPGPIQYDTVWEIRYDRTVVHKDTFWVIDPFNMVTFIPNEVLPFVVEFHQSCQDRGIFIDGKPLLVQYSNNLPGEGWNSFSYVVGFQQLIIEINEQLPPEQQRAGILRELNRLQRNKKYTTIPDRIMNPLFDPAATITASHLNELYK